MSKQEPGLGNEKTAERAATTHDPQDPAHMACDRPPDARSPREIRRDLWCLKIGFLVYVLVGWAVARITGSVTYGFLAFLMITFIASLLYFRERPPGLRD